MLLVLHEGSIVACDSVLPEGSIVLWIATHILKMIRVNKDLPGTSSSY